MKVLFVACAAGVALAFAPSEAAPARATPPEVQEPTAAAKAARDADMILDDLEARLARLHADASVEVIVTLRAPASRHRIDAVGRDVGPFTVARRFSLIDAFVATMTKAQVYRLARAADVVQIAPNSPVHAFNDTAQESFGVAKARLDVPALDGNADGSVETYSKADVVAAVIDTGIDAGHHDLDEGKVIAFANCVTGACSTRSPVDDNGHGTHVAATIAGEGDALANRTFRGVAPAGALVGVKVLDSNGSGTDAGVIAGVEWVVENKTLYGIEVVNLSLGGEGCSDGTDPVSRAVNAARDAGLVVVAAAGNEGPSTCSISSPAAADKAITVGAMADLGVDEVTSLASGPGFYQAWFSSRGPTLDGRVKPDVSGPGVDITSARSGTTAGYTDASGTSMAAPFVAGVALLMLDANSALTAAQVKEKLMATAVDWGRGGNSAIAGSRGPDVDYGAGRLDGYAALRAAGAPLTSPPLPPGRHLREGSLSGTGDVADYQVNVSDLRFPIAATMIAPSSGFSDTDFDLQLLGPDGLPVASSTSLTRQEEVGYLPAVPGTYTLRVLSSNGAGDYFLDVSGASAFAIEDVAVAEGDAASATARVRVVLSSASATTASVRYASADRSARAPGDYEPSSGVLTFAPGETSKTIPLTIKGDTLDEADEAFVVRLFAPTNAALADAEGGITIVDDDEPPTARTGGPRRIGPTSAVLTGIVDPNGKVTTAFFEYGSSSAYGKRSRSIEIDLGTGERSVSVRVDALSPRTTYHFRLVATSATGTALGADQAFVTSARPKVAVVSRRIAVSRDGRFRLRLRCPIGTAGWCRGRATLTGRVPARVLAGPRMRTIRLARKSFAVRPGRTGRVRMDLTRTALRALRRLETLRARTAVVARDRVGTVERTRRVVYLTAPRTPTRPPPVGEAHHGRQR